MKPKQIIFQLTHCSDTTEQSHHTISLHWTKLGAFKAMLAHKRECYREWNERRTLYGKKFYRGEKAFKYLEWDIKESYVFK